MCLIVDANCSHHLTNAPASIPTQEIISWLNMGGKIAIGGRNLIELTQTKFKGLALELQRKGQISRSNDLHVNAEEARIVQCMALRSDDAHVLALARISGARLVFTEDSALMDDFRNTIILPRRRGRKGAVIRAAGPSANNPDITRQSLIRSPKCA